MDIILFYFIEKRFYRIMNKLKKQKKYTLFLLIINELINEIKLQSENESQKKINKAYIKYTKKAKLYI